MSIDLEAIKARAKAASEGPWVWEVHSTTDGDEWAVFDLADRVLASCSRGWGPDAKFIAAARSGVPALVAEIERLTGEPTEDEIDRAGDVLAAHGYRVTSDWYPFCDCGWRADQMYDVAAFDRHVARVALRAARGLS